MQVTETWSIVRATLPDAVPPNRAGTTEKRTYKIAGDELTAVNPTASSGGTSYSKLVRVK